MIRSALTVFVFSVALLGWTSWRALHVDTAPKSVELDRQPLSERADSVERPQYPVRRILDAVDKNPFHPERRGSDQRFRLPSQPRVVSKVVQPPLRVLGTAVGPNGGFAMCALSGGAPRIVRVGGRVGDWVLTKVTRGAAEFTGATGATVVIHVAKASPP